MYIQDFEIKGLKWIDIKSRIKSITVKAMNQVQVVIGTNGGGKSTILAQLTPLPASRNDYFRGGYKRLFILHQGNEYEITSSFETKAGKHSFIKNGTELNISGLSSLQIDLCRDHLNYTPQLDDLTHCRYRIAQMSVAERKTLLLSLSPSTPDFVVQMHKQVKSALRASKANLNLLETRKAEIEQKLLKDEDLDELNKELETRYQEQVTTANAIYLLQEQLKSFNQEREQLRPERIVDHPDRAKKYKKRVQQLRYEVSKNGYQVRDISGLEQDILKQQEKYKHLESEYQKLETELVEYDRAILEQQDKGKKECQDTILTGEQALARVQDCLRYPTIPEEQYSQHVKAVDTVADIWRHFPPEYLRYQSFLGNPDIKQPGLGVRLMSKIQRLDGKIHNWKSQIAALNERVKQTEAEINKFPCVNRNLNCPEKECQKCGYHQYFNGMQFELYEAKKQVLEKKQELEKKIERDTRAQNKLRQMQDILDKNLDAIGAVKAALSQTVWATNSETIERHWFGRMDDYIQELTTTLQVQDTKREVIRIQKDIEAARATLHSLEKLNVPALKILKQLFANKQEQLSLTRDMALKLTERIKDNQKHLRLLQRLDNLKDTGERLLQELKVFDEYVMLSEYVHYLDSVILVQYKEKQDQLLLRINELAKIKKEQESLRAWYEKEIVAIMSKIEQKEKLYTYLEMGLSPEYGMPRYQLTLFLNAILENVNYVLSQIWTSTFRLPLIEEGASDEVSFDFKATLNDKQFAPLNKLSKSEQAVVNFAFYIALIYATGNTDYPVFFDECDDGFDSEHKRTFATWLKMYMDSSYSPQLWLICHNVETYGSLLYKDVICLNGDNIYVPAEANRHVQMEKD